MIFASILRYFIAQLENCLIWMLFFAAMFAIECVVVGMSSAQI